MKSLFKKIRSKDDNPRSPRSSKLGGRFSSADNLTDQMSSPSSPQRAQLSTQTRGVWATRRGSDKGRDVLIFTTSPHPDLATPPHTGLQHYHALREEVHKALLGPASLREPAALTADAYHRHKTLLHPHILTYISGQTSATETQLVTEMAVPLRSRISAQNITLDELCLGVVGIARALVWLHAECRMAYNNVTLDGVFVTQAGQGVPCRWCLGDFSLACPRDAEDMVEHSMAYQLVVAPEDVFEAEGRGGRGRARSFDLASRDVYALGCLIDEIISSSGLGMASANDVRRDLMGKLLEEVDSTECLGATMSNTQKSVGSSGRMEDKLADRGLEALLGEVAAAIEWVDPASLRPVMLVSRVPDVRPLDTAEEVALWSLAAMHRSPTVRPLLDDLVEGRHILGNLLVKAVLFLSEERLFADERQKAAGYNCVLQAFERCVYSDVVEFVAPLLCDRSAFLDPQGDAVYTQLLAPRRGEVSSTGLSDSVGMATGSFNDDNTLGLHSFTVGCFVEAMGLKRAPELNGMRGRVVGLDKEENRVLVTFEASNTQRAIKPEHLSRITTTGGTGVLTAADYQRIVVPFLRTALQDKLDTRMKAMLLKRAKYFVGTFDHSMIVPDVVTFLRDDSTDPALRSAACEAVPPLVSGLSSSPKNSLQLVAPVHKLVVTRNAKVADEVRVAAVTAAVSVWGGHSTALAVSACTCGLHDSRLVTATLHALACVLQADSVPPEELAGIVVPLVSPLTLSTTAEVRHLSHKVLKLALANLGRAKGLAVFPPTRQLPSPASVVASLPRQSK